jgi:glycosyltransferase involved in cell wall biosynthesis
MVDTGKGGSGAASAAPRVSIVIPVRNEVSTITATIDACLGQRYDGDIEIVVADGGSDDGTGEVLASYRDRGVRVIDNPGRTAPHGLNAAIAASSGDVIVRCDGHSILPEDYVDRVTRVLATTGASNVGGVQRAIGRTPIQRGIARAMTNPLGVGDAKFHRGGDAGPTDTVYLGAFDRSALQAVGGFDETLTRNQDYELNVRLREAGGTVWFDPEIEVVYTPRSGLLALWRQYYDYGRWKRRVVRMHPDSLRWRQAGPPILVIGLVGSVVLVATPGRALGAAVIGVYICALGAAGVYEAVASRDAAGILAGPAIAVMHIAWGAGFLTGRT